MITEKTKNKTELQSGRKTQEDIIKRKKTNEEAMMREMEGKEKKNDRDTRAPPTGIEDSGSKRERTQRCLLYQKHEAQ